MYLVYWTYVQSEQEGRCLLPLRLPDFAIQYLFQWCPCPFILPLSPGSLNLETHLASQTVEWWLAATIIGRQRHIHSQKYLGQPYCLQTSAFGIGISSGLSTADLTALDSQWKYALLYNCIIINFIRILTLIQVYCWYLSSL